MGQKTNWSGVSGMVDCMRCGLYGSFQVEVRGCDVAGFRTLTKSLRLVLLAKPEGCHAAGL